MSNKKYGNSYSGNDFYEWYETHYGKKYDGKSSFNKTEGMTDADYEIGRKLYDIQSARDLITKNYESNKSAETSRYDSIRQTLENNYSVSAKNLEQTKNAAEQRIAVAREKMMRYLPHQIKAQGLNGLGISDSAVLDVNNRYNNDLNTIMQNYTDKSTTLASEHEKDMLERELAHRDALSILERQYSADMYNTERDANGNSHVGNILDKYQTKAELEAEEKRAQALASFNDNIVQMHEDDKYMYNDALTEEGKSRIKAYLDKNRELIGDDTYEVEMQKLNEIKSGLDSKTTNVTNNKYDAKDGTWGRDVYIWIGDTDYSLKYDKDVDEKQSRELNKLTTGDASTPPNKNRVCVVNGTMYIYNVDNKWMSVTGRNISEAVADFLGEQELSTPQFNIRK